MAGKYHAAEHMAINAYEKLHRVSQLDEIKNFQGLVKTVSVIRFCTILYFIL